MVSFVFPPLFYILKLFFLLLMFSLYSINFYKSIFFLIFLKNFLLFLLDILSLFFRFPILILDLMLLVLLFYYLILLFLALFLSCPFLNIEILFYVHQFQKNVSYYFLIIFQL